MDNTAFVLLALGGIAFYRKKLYVHERCFLVCREVLMVLVKPIEERVFCILQACNLCLTVHAKGMLQYLSPESTSACVAFHIIKRLRTAVKC